MEAPALTGRLLRDRVAVGSKSEREALLLEADDGGLYVVRRRGAPTWGEEDAALGRLVGRRVALTGSVVEGTVLVDDCEPLDEPA